MKSIWMIPVLVSILILGTLGLSQNAFAPTPPFDPIPVEIPNPSPFEFDRFGRSVATNGQDIVIGAPSIKFSLVFGPGSAFLFDNTGSLTRELVRPSPQPLETFGRTVALDDTTIVIGATGVSSASGSAYEFDLTSLPDAGDFLTEYSNPLPTPADNFGLGIDVLGDFVLVGAQLDDTSGFDSGIAYLFKRTTPFTVTTIIKPAGFNQFGIDAVLGSDFLVIGAPRGIGQVNVYDYDVNGIVNLSTIIPNPGTCCQFGTTLDVDGDNILIGALNAAVGPFSDSGIVYLYDKSGMLKTTFNNPDPNTLDQFGSSVNISGDLVVIGARLDDFGATNAGSVYVFDTLGNLLQTIHNPFPAPDEHFGFGASLAGDILVIGAPGHDSNPTESGVAYLYTSSAPPTIICGVDTELLGIVCTVTQALRDQITGLQSSLATALADLATALADLATALADLAASQATNTAQDATIAAQDATIAAQDATIAAQDATITELDSIILSNEITICHKGTETKTIALGALAEHLNHGDTRGPC